jgi:hypothetical protein
VVATTALTAIQKRKVKLAVSRAAISQPTPTAAATGITAVQKRKPKFPPKALARVALPTPTVAATSTKAIQKRVLKPRRPGGPISVIATVPVAPFGYLQEVCITTADTLVSALILKDAVAFGLPVTDAAVTGLLNQDAAAIRLPISDAVVSRLQILDRECV